MEKFLRPDMPPASGRRLAIRFATDDQRTLHCWQGEFHRLNGAAYTRMPKADVRAALC
jgi:hypothetical protein